jgi:hypothetical protein
MTPSDQTLKARLVGVTALFGLLGFVLEIGPVGGAFSLVNRGAPVATALALEMATLGFLAYLALAGSAAVGLHLSEKEPTPKEEERPEPQSMRAGDGDLVGTQVRVRPEWHQFRMVVTALGGYAVLKGISSYFMWLLAPQYGVDRQVVLQAYQFGFSYIAVSWLVLWQFLRWYALKHRWVRLQAELIGGNVAQVIAVVILINPLIFFVRLAGQFSLNPTTLLAVLLHLTVVVAAVLLWTARPFTLRRSVIALLATGGVALVLTVMLAALERVVIAKL